MNIFVTHLQPDESAIALDDRRLIKMVLETAQIMSAVCYRWGVWSEDLYKVTHRNHPCTLWAGDNQHNFMWLTNHGLSLGLEYGRRFGKLHKSLEVIKQAMFKEPVSHTRLVTKLEPFVNCTPHKDLPVIEAYRRTLNEKWAADKQPPRWTNAQPPEWNNQNV